MSQGTNGRVYGGDPNYIHVPDGQRAWVGALTAAWLENEMRQGAENRTEREKEMQPLCPGCYMVVGFNMFLRLAESNGQSKKELALSMRNAFDALLKDDSISSIEEIEVKLEQACGVSAAVEETLERQGLTSATLPLTMNPNRLKPDD